MEKSKYSDWWVVALSVLIFAIWKATGLTFRFGDENVYFYMSDAILRGLVPYRDFFLADPPAFLTLFTGWRFLIGEHLLLFKLWPVVFDSLSAILIYLILRARSIRLAALGPVLYLFSFTVLSTSDYVTGGETAVFFMLLALYLDQRGRYGFSGVSWALSCLSKLYIAPALVGFMLYKLVRKHHRELGRVVLGGVAATALVLAPFLLISAGSVVDNLLLHHFDRPAGLNKWNVLSFFASMEWLLLLTAFLGAFLSKKRDLLFPLGLSVLFFLTYQDLYYLYLHTLLPYLAIYAVLLVEHIYHKYPEAGWGYIGLYLLLSIYPIYSYSSTFAPQGVFENPQEVAQALEEAPEDLPVLGAQEVAPLVALMAKRPIYGNVIDSNTQSFASGAHNLEEVSRGAVERGIYLVSRIADYPEAGIKDFGYENYFSKEIFEKYCTLYKSFDRPSTLDQLNKVNIYHCAQN